MTSTPFMQFYVSDYLGDTQHLTTEQHGAYLLLMMAMWRGQGRLPNNPEKLARIARVSPRRWHILADDIMAFFEVDGDEITQKRLAQEYKKAVSISEKRSVNGKLGGISKSLKNNNQHVANAKQLPKHSQKPEPYREKDNSNELSKKNGSRLKNDWLPSAECVQFATSLGLSQADIKIEADKFRDYWISKSGAAATKIDWTATWRNWIRNKRPSYQGPAKTAFQSHQDACKAALDRKINGDDNHDLFTPGENIIDLAQADYRRSRADGPGW